MQPVHHSLVLLPEERLKTIVELLPAASCLALGATNQKLYKIVTEVLFERLHGRDCSLNLYSSLYGKWHSELLPNSEQLFKVVAKEIRCQVANVLRFIRSQRDPHPKQVLNQLPSICYWDQLDENPAHEVSRMIEKANNVLESDDSPADPSHCHLGIEKISNWLSSRPGNLPLMTADQTFPSKKLILCYRAADCLHTVRLLLEMHNHQKTDPVEAKKLAKELYSATPHRKAELIHLLREQLPNAFTPQPLGDGTIEEFFSQEPSAVEKRSYEELVAQIRGGVEEGLFKDIEQNRIDLKETDGEGNTLLHQAIMTLFPPSVNRFMVEEEWIIRSSIEFLLADFHRRVRLNKQINICVRLIYAGADPLVQNNNGLTPLELLVQKKAELEVDRAWRKRWSHPFIGYLYTATVFLASPAALTLTLGRSCQDEVAHVFSRISISAHNSLLDKTIAFISIPILITMCLKASLIGVLLFPLSLPYLLLTYYLSNREALACGANRNFYWLADYFTESCWMDQAEKNRQQDLEEKYFHHFFKKVNMIFDIMAEEGARQPPHPSA